MVVLCALWVQMSGSPRAQLWELFLWVLRGTPTVEKKVWKGLLSVWAFVVAVFCFYCCGIHDSFVNTGPVSDGLWCPPCSRHIMMRDILLRIAHTQRNSVVSRPPDVWLCFLSYIMSTLHFSRHVAVAAAAVRAKWCACVQCWHGGLCCAVSHILLSVPLSLSHSLLLTCATHSDKCHADRGKTFLTGSYICASWLLEMQTKIYFTSALYISMFYAFQIKINFI